MESDTEIGNIVETGSPLDVVIDLMTDRPLPDTSVGLIFVNELRQRIFSLHTKYQSHLIFDCTSHTTLRCRVTSVPLIPGEYWIDIALASKDKVIERIEAAAKLKVSFSDVFGTGLLPNANQGAIAIPCAWSVESAEA
jgi:hypothetical protein